MKTLNAECCHANCHSLFCYDERRYAECSFTGCRGAVIETWRLWRNDDVDERKRGDSYWNDPDEDHGHQFQFTVNLLLVNLINFLRS